MKSDMMEVFSGLGLDVSEAFHYLNIFRNAGPGRFAVIKISGECTEDSLEQITNDLARVYSSGLIPVVTYGWGGILNRKLMESGKEVNFNTPNGDRYTDAEMMGYVLEAANSAGTALLQSMLSRGIKAQVVPYDKKVIIASDKKEKGFGEHNGNVEGINIQPALDLILKECVPIITPIGISNDGEKLYNINGDTASTELVRSLDPEKYIMLTSTSGVLDNPSSKDGKLISEIVLRRDYESLVRNGILQGGMKKKIDEAAYSLNSRENGDDRSVQIVSPGNLMAELFTKRGNGTYVRNGYVINRQHISRVSKPLVREIIEGAFGENLRDDYFTSPDDDYIRQAKGIVYSERNNKGLGIVIPHMFANYLDIVAVGSEYQRNGLGGDIIQAVGPKIFWRSKPGRDANHLYMKLSDGHVKLTSKDGIDYNGFWKGLDWDGMRNAVFIMQNQPSNFKQKS